MPKNWTTWRKLDKFLETCTLPRLNDEDIENLNRSIASKEIESLIKIFQSNTLGQMVLLQSFIKHLKKN